MFLAENEGGTYSQALQKICEDANKKAEFVADFGIEPEEALTLLNAGHLRESLLDLVVCNTFYKIQDYRKMWE